MSAPRFPLGGLLIILGCLFLGSAAEAFTGLPVPGAVLGMLLFLAYLQWRKPGAGTGSVRAADGLLANMQLFFIPPGVGIVAHLALLRSEWVAALGGFFASWVAALLVTAVTAVLLLRLRRPGGRAAGAESAGSEPPGADAPGERRGTGR